MTKALLITDERVLSKIVVVRGKKVILDRDLAEMYGVDTAQLKRQVKRNMRRFPEDFMFEMTRAELQNWRRQFGISKTDKMGLRYLPFCFTEQGVAMLSSVLNSKTAIDVNIRIIRVFNRMREILVSHADLFLRLENLENTMLMQKDKLTKHDQELRSIFTALRELLNPPIKSSSRIGFKRKGEE